MSAPLRRIEGLFALWVVLFSAWAMAEPARFAPLRPHIPLLLGVVMAGMGMTLTGADFRAVARAPGAVAAGVAAQYGVMPLLGWLIARALRLSPEIATGVILVGACPGGTASNVIAYLARGDVALSVSMTLVSTLLAPLLTPWLTQALAGRYAPVPAGALMAETARVVILPLAAGLAARRLFPGLVRRALPALPALSMAAIVAIIACVVALSAGKIATAGAAALFAVILHNLGGVAAGYGLGALFGFPKTRRITLAVEVGMQNSGLGAALATQFFSPAAALPSAIFSAWHNLSGSALAWWWGRRRD